MAPDVEGLSEAEEAAKTAAKSTADLIGNTAETLGLDPNALGTVANAATEGMAEAPIEQSAQSVGDVVGSAMDDAQDMLGSTAKAVGLDPASIGLDQGTSVSLGDVTGQAIDFAVNTTGMSLPEEGGGLFSGMDDFVTGLGVPGASEGAGQVIASSTGAETAGDLIGSVTMEDVPSDVVPSLSLGEAAPMSDVGDISLDALGSGDSAEAAGDALGSAAGDAADAGIGLGDVAGALGYIQAGADVLQGEYTEAAGELAGSALGDAVAGPIGGMVGGFVGQEVGTVLDDAGVNDVIDAAGSGVEDAAVAAGSVVSDAAGEVADAAEGAASDVEDAAQSAASDVGDAASEVADDIGDLF